jgi:hypothetical protein
LEEKADAPVMNKDWPDIIKFNGWIFYKNQAALDAYLKREAKREARKHNPKPKKVDAITRNTARSLAARPKDSWADWTQPRWKTGGNPGLFVEGGDCCPK